MDFTRAFILRSNEDQLYTHAAEQQRLDRRASRLRTLLFPLLNLTLLVAVYYGYRVFDYQSWLRLTDNAWTLCQSLIGN
ncbi:hypothetical protein [Acidisoma silvae]|uniref:Uncharacterized protein n=1 Tax=Acidisoma silvae TaxID=2802396 RepID=A0A963YT33_9PROT|nr:hypothetical protein [Acidisoma silvae]MCB8876475.1 hypothetical protein [Acidisoma silvae]